MLSANVSRRPLIGRVNRRPTAPGRSSSRPRVRPCTPHASCRLSCGQCGCPGRWATPTRRSRPSCLCGLYQTAAALRRSDSRCPLRAASASRYVFQSSPVARRTMLFMAASASSIVESTATVLPASSFFCTRQLSRQTRTSPRVLPAAAGRESATSWSGQAFPPSAAQPRNSASERLSLHRQAMPRWELIPSEIADQDHAKVHARRYRLAATVPRR